VTRQRFLALAFLAAFSATALLAPPAPAQGCRSAHFGYATPVYAAPAYSYTPTYVAPSYDYPPIQATVITQEVLAPAYVFQVLNAFQPPAPANTTPYQPAAPPPPCQNATVRLDPAQLAELAALIRAANPPPPADDGPPPFGDALAATAATAATPTANRDTAADEIAVLQYFGTACAKCHTGANVKGGVRLFDEAGYFKPGRTNGQPLALSEITASVHPVTGTMPKGGPKMPPELFARIPPHWHGQQTALR
jgi:mono/diheme cytochrome c family protein